jgi:serine/threonine protein kinase
MAVGETLQIRRRITQGNLLFGEYTLLHVVAQGRVGVLCEAEHNSLKRKCALKMVHPNYAEKEGYSFALIESFLREARVMASVDHPNVVPVYHGGTIGQCPFIAMRFIRGGTLAKRVAKTGAVTPDWGLRLLRECAEGLQALHAAGYFHGDLQPENILLEPDGSPRIGDFDQSAALEVGRTPSTPQPNAFAAPELVAGEKVDQRADLFALGATIHVAVTAVEPTPGADAGAVAEAMARATPAVARAPQMAAGLAAIVAKCLVPDREQRYRNAEEAIHDCRLVADGEAPEHALGKGRNRKDLFAGWKAKSEPADEGDPFPE